LKKWAVVGDQFSVEEKRVEARLGKGVAVAAESCCYKGRAN
jgi:hypothetical protein